MLSSSHVDTSEPKPVWHNSKLFFGVTAKDFIVANANLCATGHIIGKIESMKPPNDFNYGYSYSVPVRDAGEIMLSAEDYAIFQIALKGVEHIEATARNITNLHTGVATNTVVKMRATDPFPKVQPPKITLTSFRPSPSPYGASLNMFGSVNSTPVMTPRTTD